MLPPSSVLVDVAGSLDFSTYQPTRRLVPEYRNLDTSARISHLTKS